MVFIPLCFHIQNISGKHTLRSSVLSLTRLPRSRKVLGGNFYKQSRLWPVGITDGPRVSIRDCRENMRKRNWPCTKIYVKVRVLLFTTWWDGDWACNWRTGILLRCGTRWALNSSEVFFRRICQYSKSTEIKCRAFTGRVHCR